MHQRIPLVTRLGQFPQALVFGSVEFGDDPTNYFDPGNGFVPNGYSNKTQGTIVTVTNPAIEFGFNDGANYDTIDITNDTITLTDKSRPIQFESFIVKSEGDLVSYSPALFTLKSPAFEGLTFTEISNTYPSGFVMQTSSDSLSLSAPSLGESGTYSAVYKVTNNNAAATPEPGSIALLVGMGITGAGVLRKRRK